MRDPVRILIMGTATHDADYALIEPALARLKAIFGDRVTIDVLGVRPRGGSRMGSPVCGYPTTRHCPIPGSCTGLPAGAVGMSVSRRWLNTRFNAAKSAIKTLDYAALGLAVLASDGPVYRGSIPDGGGGELVANDQAAWLAALSDMVQRPERRRLMGAAAFARFLREGTLASRAEMRRRALLTALPTSWPAVRAGIAPAAPQDGT